MQALPSPDHPEPQAAKTYLLTMAQAMENRPAPIERLSSGMKRSLIAWLALHYDMIAYELDLEAWLAERESLGEAAGEMAAILGNVSPEAKAGGAAMRFIAGRGRKNRHARLRELQKLAFGVRKLLLLLRLSLLKAS